jgi:quercetin dioxygenase-like cupin family protein
MPVIRVDDAPQFSLHGASFRGLAAPSRGSKETSVWRVSLPAGAPGAAHSVDREEIFVALSGRALATLEGKHHELCAGDTLIVPAGLTFSLANPGTEAFEALAVAPAGVRAQLPGGEPFAPPWTT